jgi:protein phosphatase
VELAWGSRSDVGLRRKANEDALIAEFPIFLVADGMGGHQAGGVASERALEAFRPLVGRDAVSLSEFAEAFTQAVGLVAGIDSPQAAAGTTISGIAVSEHDGITYWLVINIGDSRTYRLVDGELEQISVDHSAVQELIDAGKISPLEAERHPERNVITKAVGAGSRAEPDYWLIPASTDDRLLICSDGLSKELTATEITRVLAEEASPVTAADRLVHEALLHGGHDNVSVIVVDAVALSDNEEPTVPSIDINVDVETVPRLTIQGAGNG